MINRGVVPEWLARSNFERRFILIEEHDLALDARLSERLMGMYGIRLSDDGRLHRLVETSEGNWVIPLTEPPRSYSPECRLTTHSNTTKSSI